MERPKGSGSATDPTDLAGTERAQPSGAGEPGRGRQVGRFSLLERLGAGGMGVVWSAFDPQLDRKIALKFVRAELAGPEMLARLMREAQALARVSHPNVITVLDAGREGDELYIAQEFVRGADLAKWLSAAPRRHEEILEVFLQAGRGLAAAHSAGIVHRDFKPANVLVGDDGRVRVVDFGLARSAKDQPDPQPVNPHAETRRSGPSPAIDTPLTHTGEVMGTPLYMAPEQHLGQVCDGRGDQFSFCVALWQALYGEPPFAGATVAELAREVIAGNLRPPPAGARVPARLREAMRRGLQTDPSDRFAQMEELLAALAPAVAPSRRWLSRLALATGALLAVAGVALYLHHRSALCSGGDDKLTAVWDGARKQAAHAAFLATGAPYAEFAWGGIEHTLDGYGRDWAAMHGEACRATRLRGEQSEEVLDLRMACLDERLQELDATAKVLVSADKAVVQHASEIAAGLAPLSGCADVAALKEPVRAPRGPAARAKVVEAREWLARARALDDGARYPDALAAARGALERARAVGWEPVEAEALYRLGGVQARSGKGADAEKTLEQAFEAAESSRAEPVAASAATLLVSVTGTALAHRADGHRWEGIAQAALRRSPDPRTEVQLRLSQSRLLNDEGKYDGAMAAARQGLAAAALLPPNDLGVAQAHAAIGTALRRLGRLEEALVELKLGLAIRERALGPDHPEVAASENGIGNTLRDLGRLDESLVELRRSLAIRERALGPDHPDVATSHNNIARPLMSQGKLDEALAEMQKTLAIRLRVLPADHPDIVAAHNNLGAVLNAMRRSEEALVEYRLALAGQLKTLGPEHPDTAMTECNIGVALTELGRAAEALAPLEQALAVREKVLGPVHPDTAESVGSLGEAHLALHDYRAAERELTRALEIHQAKAPMPDVLGEFHFALARARLGAGERAAAIDAAKLAQADFAKVAARKRQAAEVDAWLAANGKKK